MTKVRCLIVQPIHPAGESHLAESGVLPVGSLASVDVITIEAAITRSAGFSAEQMSGLPNLRVVAVHGVGYDPVDIGAASRLGIAVTNTPGTNERSVAEHAIAMMFALQKQIVDADAAVRRGDEDYKYSATLTEIEGLTLGIVGFGRIGQQVAALGRALGMRVVALSRHQPDALFGKLGVSRAQSLESVLRVSDVVSLHLPSNDETRDIIGKNQLALMKPTALLINTGRGSTVDEYALIDALRSGAIRGAGLDVFRSEPLQPDHPLCVLKNVILSPHVAGSTEAALRRTAITAADCVLRVLSNERPDALVNPEVWESRRR